jgi:inner membrane protease subunit 2
MTSSFFFFSSDTIKQKETQVPQGHVWVEGDNKRASYDSRHFGYVSKIDHSIEQSDSLQVARGLITGRALYVIWPPNRFGTKLTLLNNNDDDDDFS